MGGFWAGRGARTWREKARSRWAELEARGAFCQEGGAKNGSGWCEQREFTVGGARGEEDRVVPGGRSPLGGWGQKLGGAARGPGRGRGQARGRVC